MPLREQNETGLRCASDFILYVLFLYVTFCELKTPSKYNDALQCEAQTVGNHEFLLCASGRSWLRHTGCAKDEIASTFMLCRLAMVPRIEKSQVLSLVPITSTVRICISMSNACCTRCSLSASRAEVASSSKSIRGSCEGETTSFIMTSSNMQDVLSKAPLAASARQKASLPSPQPLCHIRPGTG